MRRKEKPLTTIDYWECSEKDVLWDSSGTDFY